MLDADARIFLFKGFLSPDEADHIRAISEERMTRSGVVEANGGSTVSDIRTSSGTFLERGEDEVVRRVEERIASWSLLPAKNGEGLQVLRYHKTQKYDAHWDYFFHKEGTANGGNRYATVLMYLETTEEGGETVFPNIPAPGGDNGPTFSDCARHHLAAKPVKGDAILFHSIAPSGALERKSLHTACPVIKGIKWSAAKWLHVSHYVTNTVSDGPIEAVEQTINEIGRKQEPGRCVDLNDLCPDWARAGECTRNEAFMVGSRARPGQCLLACGRCDLVMKSGGEAQHLPKGQEGHVGSARDEE